MAHSSAKRWEEVSAQTSGSSDGVLSVISVGEETYQDLLELWAFAGGTDQLVADQLFSEAISARNDTAANAVEVAQVADAKAAMLAIHQLYQAMTNVAITQDDRIAKLRRFT